MLFLKVLQLLFVPKQHFDSFKEQLLTSEPRIREATRSYALVYSQEKCSQLEHQLLFFSLIIPALPQLTELSGNDQNECERSDLTPYFNALHAPHAGQKSTFCSQLLYDSSSSIHPEMDENAADREADGLGERGGSMQSRC